MPFNLKMATQHGEKVARDSGFSRFPVRPIEIAEKADIAVECKPPEVEGVSGAIIMVGGNVRIIYSGHLNNRGFENFCVSHELGHYFLAGHPHAIIKGGGFHLSRANFTESQPIELEADHFAAGLLLPAALTEMFLDSHQIGMEGVLALADAAECSRTSAAIRAAQCSTYPVAVIVSRGTEIAYAFVSEKFKELSNGQLAWLRKGSALPNSLTRRFNSKPSNVLNAERACSETHIGDWFGGPRGIPLDEEIVGLGRYGFTLTVLSTEAQATSADDDEDDAAELERSWTPKFAYGR